MTTDDHRETVAEIMHETDIAVLTYQSLAGALVSTPMGMQDFEDPGTIWFITERSSDKVQALEADPRVNISCSSKKGWVSLAGTAHVSDDRAKLEELWDASAGAFMSGGPEDPDNVLLRIDGDTAEYWENPGKVAIAVQVAKGLVTDGEPDLGDNDTVSL
ncbi:MAG TPA: pyridoxamine 5'-phosphate oxidase family protein [Nocardioides sp.]|nr:pyridoxamine 5'-phosphate oxidase family protein [Nocardioides sp.]